MDEPHISNSALDDSFFSPPVKVEIDDDMLSDNNIITFVQRKRMDILLNKSAYSDDDLAIMRDLVGTSLANKKIKVDESTGIAGQLIVAEYIREVMGKRSAMFSQGTGNSISSRLVDHDINLPDIDLVPGQDLTEELNLEITANELNSK